MNAADIGVSPEVSSADVQKDSLSSQITMTNKELGELQAERNKIQREIDMYTTRIESGPQIELMLIDLNRGYDRADKNYQSLLEKKMKAELAENLERAQQGEQFTILDPAALPETPFSPNLGKILFVGFVMGIASGLGIALLREYVDLSFWSSKELESAMDMPVLVSVPIVNTPAEVLKKSARKAGAIGALISMACILLLALFVLWKMDPALVQALPG
jgi:hypothetical protein